MGNSNLSYFEMQIISGEVPKDKSRQYISKLGNKKLKSLMFTLVYLLFFLVGISLLLLDPLEGWRFWFHLVIYTYFFLLGVLGVLEVFQLQRKIDKLKIGMTHHK